MYDLLHEAEKSIRRGGLTDHHYLTRLTVEALGHSKNEEPKKGDVNDLSVCKFTAGIYNASDIKVDYHLPSDRVFLHDVHANLAYIFRDFKNTASNQITGIQAQELINRAKSLRMSLTKEVTVTVGPNLRGSALQRLLRLGYNHLQVLDLFYVVNALSISEGREFETIRHKVFPYMNALGKDSAIEGLLALTHMIPADAIANAVTINNILTGTVSSYVDVDDDVQHYVTAIKLITGSYSNK